MAAAPLEPYLETRQVGISQAYTPYSVSSPGISQNECVNERAEKANTSGPLYRVLGPITGLRGSVQVQCTWFPSQNGYLYCTFVGPPLDRVPSILHHPPPSSPFFTRKKKRADHGPTDPAVPSSRPTDGFFATCMGGGRTPYLLVLDFYEYLPWTRSRHSKLAVDTVFSKLIRA